MAKNPLTHFKTFPEFSTLTLADREIYEEFIADFPPYTSLSFGELMTWWSYFDSCRISQLNGNLIISYWQVHNPDSSGLAVIGKRKIDETICQIFDHFKSEKRAPVLKYVPEFVIEQIKYPDLFVFEDMREDDECIISIEKFSNIDELPPTKRPRVLRALADINGPAIEVQELDLGNLHVQESVLHQVGQWEKHGFNSVGKVEEECFMEAVLHAADYGYKALGLCIAGRLHGLIVYQETSDPEYVMINYGRFDYRFHNIYELSVYKFAEWWTRQGAKYANIDNDLGLQNLRSLKLFLGPEEFLRKYRLTPKS